MNRFVDVIYCDDIRQEASGKLIFVGVYSNSLIIRAQGATTLPQLCLMIRVFTPETQPFSRLLLRILRDDVVLEERTIPAPRESVERAVATRPAGNTDPAFLSINIGVVLAPFDISTPGTLRVRVLMDDEEIRGPALAILHFAPDQGGESQGTP